MHIVSGFGRAAKTGLLLFEYLEKNPIIDIGKTAAELNLSFNTVANAVKRFVQQGILAQCSNADRYRVFSYEAYLKILRKDT